MDRNTVPSTSYKLARAMVALREGGVDRNSDDVPLNPFVPPDVALREGGVDRNSGNIAGMRGHVHGRSPSARGAWIATVRPASFLDRVALDLSPSARGAWIATDLLPTASSQRQGMCRPPRGGRGSQLSSSVDARVAWMPPCRPPRGGRGSQPAQVVPMVTIVAASVALREGGVDRNTWGTAERMVTSTAVALREGGVDRNHQTDEQVEHKCALVALREGGVDRNNLPRHRHGYPQGMCRPPRGGRGSQHPMTPATFSSGCRLVALREGGVDRNTAQVVEE